MLHFPVRVDDNENQALSIIPWQGVEGGTGKRKTQGGTGISGPICENRKTMSLVTFPQMLCNTCTPKKEQSRGVSMSHEIFTVQSL